MLRAKLVTLLSIYIKYGYSKESKDRACEMLDLKKTNLNCLNSELRDGGFLIKSEMNTRDSYLNAELQELSDYYKSNGDNPTMVLFSLILDPANRNFWAPSYPSKGVVIGDENGPWI